LNLSENTLKLAFIQRHFFSIYFVVYLGLSLLFWLFVSQEFASSPVVLSFVSSVAEYVPMLQSIEKIPGSNPKIRFFYAALWSLVPLLILYPWLLPMEKRISEVQRHSLPTTRATWYGFAFSGACLLMTLVWPVGSGSPSHRDSVLTGDALGSIFFGWIASFSALMFGLSLWGLFASLKLRSTNSNTN
jgi:hypothetical protein